MSQSTMESNKSLSRKALTRQVADQLWARIRDERLAPDTVLGTEADLAVQFGVSRTVIREAVGELRGLGLVRSRQGLGLCVASGDVFDTLNRTLAPTVSDASNWSELCHMRFVLEVGSLPLAVERATSDQISRMCLLAKEMLGMVKHPDRDEKDVESFVAEREIEFHRLVFDAAGSKFASRFHSLLSEYFHESYGPGPHGTPPTLKDMKDHVKLADAVAKRDVCGAHAILIDHIRNTLSV